MGRHRKKDPYPARPDLSAHRDHKESKVNRVKLVFLVPLVLLGWTVLSVLVAVTVGKVIAAHEERQDRKDQQARLDRMVPTGYRVKLGLKDHQALLEGLARVDPWDQQAHPPRDSIAHPDFPRDPFY